MKINVEAQGGVLLSSLKGGDTFAHHNNPSEIYIKLDLCTTSHLNFSNKDVDRIAIAYCSSGRVKCWLDCKVIPVDTVLEGV